MTTHTFVNENALNVQIDKEVHLVLTSPPYPMIEMWDDCFSKINPEIKSCLDQGKGNDAWFLMTEIVNQVLTQSTKTLINGGFLIVNIGDATRTLGEFALYPTHSFIDYYCIRNLGLTRLTSIYWNKPSNKPNKYMGSGMLPVGAYVTLENEHILIYRKGGKRKFEDKLLRQKSAYFWEERNKWFSDIWTDVHGASQKIDSEVRERSAAFPHELAYRLIAMYSTYGDTILDPFVGLGTTLLAAMNLGRNSLGIEIEKPLIEHGVKWLVGSKNYCNDYTQRRLDKHIQFVKDGKVAGKTFKHNNKPYGFPVVTSQEKSLFLDIINEIQMDEAISNTVVAK